MHSNAPSFQAVPDELDGLALTGSGSRAPHVRQRVMEAHVHQWAVCEFAVVDLGTRFALDPAHIKRSLASWPNEIRNGLVLSALHHKVLDEGVFTLLPENLRAAVATGLSGRGGLRRVAAEIQRSAVAPQAGRRWHPCRLLAISLSCRPAGC